MAAGGRANASDNAAAEAEYTAVTTGLTSAQGEADSIKPLLEAALKDGDYGKAAELQMRAARVGARIERLEEAKGAYDAVRPAPGQPRQAPQQTQGPDWNLPWTAEGFEAYLRTRTAMSAAWLREHPQFATDVSFRNAVGGAHEYISKTLRIAPDTPAYFAKLEESVGIRQAPTAPQPQPQPQPQPAAAPATPAAPHSAAAPATPRQSAPPPASRPAPAAPPSNSVPSPSGRPGPGGTTVTLSAEERRVARQTFTKESSPAVAAGMDAEEAYARQKARLIEEGRWHGPA
jgi:hypothetical protein